jgi:photosystem II stability/assembly factor-like uncharacterized protein
MRPRAIATSLLLFVAIAAHALTWSNHGPHGGAVKAILVAQSDPRVIYAGTTGALLRSVGGGMTWTNISGPLNGVAHLAGDPTNANTVYASTVNQVWKTADAGASWTRLANGLPDGLLPSAILVDPTNPSIVYVGSHCGVIGFAASSVETKFHESAGVFRSIDAGATFTPMFNGLEGRFFSLCVEELSLDPATPQHLFAAPVYTDGGFSESFNHADLWTRADGPVPARAILVDPRFPLTRYGLTTRASAPLLKSTDGGLTWLATAAKGLPLFELSDLAIDPATARLFASSRQGIFRSGDGGDTWVPMSGPKGQVNRLVVDGAGSLLAGTEAGLYRAPLATLGPWSLLPTPDAATSVVHVAVDPRDASVVYSVTNDYYIGDGNNHARVFRSGDFGATWELFFESSTGSFYMPLAVDAAGTIFIGRTNGGLLRIDAVTREAVAVSPFFNFDQVVAIAADPKRPGFIYAGHPLRGITVSNDGGATWSQPRSEVGSTTIAIDPQNTSVVYTGGRLGTWKSVDSGKTWTQLDARDTALIAVAPSRPSTVYRTTTDNENFTSRIILWRSDDGGTSWTRLSRPQENGRVSTLVVDPRDDRSLWVFAMDVAPFVQHSSDGGVTWASAGGNLPRPAVDAVIDREGLVMHAAVPGNGVWDAPLTIRRRAATR